VAKAATSKRADKASASAPPSTTPPTPNRERPPQPRRHEAGRDELLEFYRQMLLIRRFEERAGQLYGLGLIGGFCHLYIGQEAVAVGLQSAMDPKSDSVITGYRDHGHMLAYGIDPRVIMAELTGRAAGISKGKGGSMHMFSVEHKFYGGHGIVGAQVSLGTGLLSSTNMPATAASAWPISETAPPTRARSTRASTWPSCGSCRSST
jgi:pyruvate dehydrogenase E1 component alpha subunit